MDNKKEIIGKSIQPTPVRYKEIGIDTTNNLENIIIDGVQSSSVDLNSIEGFSNVAQTRENVYNVIDTMSQDGKISAVLETYAEDTVEQNDNGKIVWCEAKDDATYKYITYLIDSLNIDKNIYAWAFSLIKYGDVYLRLFRESDYGDDLLFGSSENNGGGKSLKEDVLLNITKKGDHYVPYLEMVANPGEMFELTKFGKTMGYIQAPIKIQQNYDLTNSYNTLKYKMNKSDVTVFNAKDFVHACLEDNSSRTPEEVNIFEGSDEDAINNKQYVYKVKRGQSLLYNSFRTWRQLSLLENSVMLNRITKSAIVRILSINVGDMPKEQVNNYLQRIKDKIEQKSALDVGDSLQNYTNPGPIENIIYVPTHGENGTISAQNIGGDDVDVGKLTDLDYFQNKLYGDLRVPKQFFALTDDGAGFNGGSSLTIISSRYGKEIKRIQNQLCQLITDVINLFLLDRGMKSSVNNFTIRMQAPTTQEEIDKREVMRNKVSVIQDIISNIGNVVNDDMVKLKITKSLLSEVISNEEVINLLQEYVDKVELENEQKENGEEGENTEPEEGNDMGERPSFGDEFGAEPTPFIDEEEPEEGGGEERVATTFGNQEGEVLDNEVGEQEIGGGEENSYLPSFDELGVQGI